MCTAIAFRGSDLLYGFDLDLDPAAWPYCVKKTPALFAVGITAGRTTYLVHGVNRAGQFGNVPYMNAQPSPAPHGVRRERIDLMNDRYIRGRYTFEDVEQILKTRAVTCIPAAAMHSLIGSADGQIRIVEPGFGVRAVEEHFAVLTNFPVLTQRPTDGSPFYGLDRYDRAQAVLSAAGPEFCVQDALQLLYDVRQEGQWATRVSFVWSKNENAVYYFLNGDISQVQVHRFQ